jgi:hypothetical protein
MRYLLFIFLVLCFSCKGKRNHYPARASAPLRSFPKTNDKLSVHPRLIRKILDKLDVIPDLKDFYTATNPYSRSLTQLYDLTPDKRPYSNFVIVMPGGSGGEDLRVYSLNDTNYVEVQDFFAFYDTLPGAVHNGFKDIQINYHNHSPFDYVTMNYKWNGSKYVWDRCVEVNDIPYDSLVAQKRLDPRKTSENYPWVEWINGGQFPQR